VTDTTDQPPVDEQIYPARRRSKRIPMEAIVHYQVDGSEFINLSSNISSEGIFIKNFSPPAVGTELRIKVALPEDLGGVPVQLLGEVVRVVDGVGVEERGMGVEFTSVQADTLEAVRYFVNEVYEVEQLEDLKVEKDEETGGFTYTPGPEDVLRLQADLPDSEVSSPGLVRVSQQRLIRSLLLILVGILLGGGFVFLFFLID
jgi:uncharacterized protein (TIGR02266 family)